MNILNVIGLPLLEIILALGVGAIVGFILNFAMGWFKSRANRLICMLTATFLCVSLCSLFGLWFGIELSSLLTCMMIGAVFCNLRKDALHIIEGIEAWTPALFMLFFVLSRSELDFSTITLPTVGICVVYLITRSCGEYFGARWGCSINNTNSNVKNFLGLTLLPQAGVAMGMAKSASSTFKTIGEQAFIANPNFIGTEYLNYLGATITAVVLCATLVYELFGPLITKTALIKAGEIKV